MIFMNAYHEFDWLMFTTISAGAREVAALFWSVRRFLPPAKYDNPGDQEIDLAIWPDQDERRRSCESYRISQVDFDLHWGYVNRPERAWHPEQLFFWEPRSNPGHSVMMGNSLDGYQHASFIPSQETSWQYTFSSILDPQDESPYCMFDYFCDHRRVARHVAAGFAEEDKKWIFCQEGPVQPFEKPDYYSRRRIKDRFNREVNSEYLLKLGYDITSDDFWTTEKSAWVVWTDFYGKVSQPRKCG